MMRGRILVFLLLFSKYWLVAVAETAHEDFAALKSLMDSLQNTPPTWTGSDPCGDNWEGIKCTNSHITSITLASTDLTGTLSGDIGSLTDLEILDLSYNKGLTGSLPENIGNLKKLSTLILVGCGFNGPIPDDIGYLQELRYLSLNSNGFIGKIPPSIGNLSKLYWLDLADNQLNGPIPVSSGNTPGLDMLHQTKHFHFGKNKLSGHIPPQLFSSEMSLIHVLFESNKLNGSIPSTIGLVQSLEVVRLDDNSLSGSVPENISNLMKVQEMYLSNNKLSGSLPNLAEMNALSYLDVSNNSFAPWEFPSWFSDLQSLTTLKMEDTHLIGPISSSLFSLVNLQTVALKGNNLNGTLDIGTASKQLRLIDLQSNAIDNFKQRDAVFNVKIILKNNPVCEETGVTETYCTDSQPNDNDIPYTTPLKNCEPPTCSLERFPSPNCICSYPYTGTLTFRAPSFSDLGNDTNYQTLEEFLMISFDNHDLPVDSVSLSHPTRDSNQYLKLSLKVFPLKQDRFNRTGILNIAFLLSNQTFKPPHNFGPFYFSADTYGKFGNSGPGGSSKSLNGIIIGAVVGGSVLVLLLILAGVYAFFQKKRAERAIDHNNPFRRWDTSESNSGGVPRLKGARQFSFEEIKKYTSNFSQANEIGSGGYGKVYKGTLANGQLLAIKRAQKESMQGGLEFKSEIELLSRVHHKNLVALIGFCFDKGEQMLVYEYVPNGTLKDSISGKLGIRLDWIRRLKISLGAARGLAYLHEHANPPIIHRDIKSNNILLDERLNAKVADFGLSKSMVDSEKDHITTQVKGTMGYLDPEYYMTQQLTEKSDVYSFGVLILELITARRPLERGKYIVKEVKNAINKEKELYGLHEIIDPTIIGLGPALIGLERFVDLAMKCVEESGSDRPAMSNVVKEIENLLQLAGANPHADSASTSASYEDISKGSSNHPYSNDFFDSGGVLSNPKSR